MKNNNKMETVIENKTLLPSYVGLTKRVVAYIMDVLFFWAIIALCFQFYPDHYAFYLAEENSVHSDYILIIYLSVFFLYCLDQIAGPIFFGRTVTRWIMGYKITRLKGGYPKFWQAFVRFILIVTMELFTFGIVSFFTRLFRKDKATLHDLASKTRATYPEEEQGNLFVRISFALLICVLAVLYIIVNIQYILYAEISAPTEKKSELAGLYPKEINVRASFKNSIAVNGIGIRSNSAINVCQIAKNIKGKDIYRLYIDREAYKLTLQKTTEAIFLPDKLEQLFFREDDDDNNPVFNKYTGLFFKFIRNLPFHSDKHVMAAKVSVIEPPQFSLFKPLDSMAYTFSKMSFVLTLPDGSSSSSQEFFIRPQSDYFVYSMHTYSDHFNWDELYIVNADYSWRVSLTTDVKSVFTNINFKEFYRSIIPVASKKIVPLCEE